MTINNRTNLINQICTTSELSGKALEELKARLAKMSEAELQTELTKSLAGNNLYRDMGLKVEKTTTQKISKEQESQLKSALTARLNAVSTNVKKAEDSNGFLGTTWSWAKNTFNFGDSSDKVRKQQKADLKALESGNIKEAFKQITGLDYTLENVNKFLNNEVQTKSETALNGYTEGQDMASDITADIFSGIAAVGIYTAAVAAAPFTGGTSIAVGVAAAGASAAAIKTGIKYADAKSGSREYTADNLKKDLATGAFSGVLAPFTGGMGGAVGKTVATKVGIQAVKQVGKEVAEEAVEETAKGFVKTALTNPYGYEYIGGNVLKRARAYSAEMITDGAVSGFFDSAFRTAYDGCSLEEVGKSAVMGGVSGGAGAWFLGGSIKVFGRGMQKVFGKNNVQIDAQGNRVRVNDFNIEQNFNFFAIAKEDNIPEQTLHIILNNDVLKKVYVELRKLDCIPKEDLSKIMQNAPTSKDLNIINKYLELTEKIYVNNNCEPHLKAKILNSIYDFDKNSIDDFITLINDKDFPNDIIIDLGSALQNFASYNNSGSKTLPKLEFLKLYKEFGLTPNQLLVYYQQLGKLSVEDLQNQCKMLGKNTINNMPVTDLAITCHLQKLRNIQDINELPLDEQKLLLNKLVSGFDGMFDISDKMHEHYPLIPRNLGDYCSLIKSLAHSIGIESNPVSNLQKLQLHTSLDNLTSILKNLSGPEILNLKLTQEYSRESFINDVLQKTKGLSQQGQNIVLSFFGFKLTPNKNNPTGYTISRYPVNIEGKRLEVEIQDLKLRQIVESLKDNVSRFSTKNQIKCDNPEIQSLLNQIVEILPEVHTMVGRKNINGNDILLSSLRTLNAISKNPNYLSLSKNDQKILQLSTLLHNISEFEGGKDITHTRESAFDAYHIVNKIDLSKEEKLKLYTLIKNHEWIDFIKQAKSTMDITKRLQSLAYDLRNGNILDMLLILSQTKLKKNDLKLFDKFSNVLRKNIAKLKVEQPVLPTTKIPKLSEIKKAFKSVNSDSSIIGHDGNIIKGVYQGRDGLVIIKYNEVENWEQLGFPSGTKSKGVTINAIDKEGKLSFATNGVMASNADSSIEINTGNIKFFIHGFHSESDLIRFKEFLNPDSENVLSMSYVQRPETKYHFFSKEGILLDIPTQNVHVGSFSDIGTGWKKTLSDIKNDYIFDGYRAEDRCCISKAIKEVTNMSDSEYVEFVEKFGDKPISDIYPKELQNKIVKAISIIGDNRERYNEILCSNPTKITGLYMTITDQYDNLIDYIASNTHSSYLKKYALENDLPLFIFGD